MRLRLAVMLFALALPAGADSVPKPAPPAPKKLTLAQALAAAPPPAAGLLLSVSPEQVMLPDGAEPPPADAATSDIAAAFGDQAVSFSSVTAIAPSTMAVLNTQPNPPNLMADMNSWVALKMLAASLDDAQWQALTSERGLGLADLTDDIQRGLFYGLFPRGELWIGSEDPALKDMPQEKRTDVQNVSDQIDTVRVRLGQTAHFYLHDITGGTIYQTLDRPDAAQRLHIFRPKSTPSPTEYGVALKVEVPNALKPSDLDYDSHALQTPMPVAGLKTVGDLVTRIGLQTKLELYADPHYAARMLLVQGTATAAPAADLLQALCVCVTGTFRKVGPAYVLTDDLMGVGTRRKYLEDWEDEADHVQDLLQDQAGSTMLARHAADARKLPTFGDPLALTGEELSSFPDSPEMPGLPEDYGHNLRPFAKLTSAQQAWMRQAAAEYNDQIRSDPQMAGQTEASVARDVEVRTNYQVQYLVPSQSQPVDAFSSPIGIFYFPGMDALMPKGKEVDAMERAKTLAKMPPAPPLSAALRLGQCSAVEAHTRTAKDVDALVAAMQKLGLNALLLDVFSGGVNHVTASAGAGPDILTEALARTRGTGIRVYADMSLLAWGDMPPDSVQDLTIDGQNSRNAAIQTYKIAPSTEYDNNDDPIPFTAPPVAASPSSPQAQAVLTALIQGIAAQPTLAGFVWEDAGTDRGLGYTLDRRLQFLRSAHADPVDTTEGPDALQARTKLPLFDDATINAAVKAQWTKAQNQADAELLGLLHGAARRGDGTMLPILVDTRTFTDHWLVSWDNAHPQQPLPLPQQQADGIYVSEETIMRLARSQGRIVLRTETIENDGETPALARKLSDDLKAMPSDGFVLEFRHDEVTEGAAPLAALVETVSAESSKGSGKTAEKTVK